MIGLKTKASLLRVQSKILPASMLYGSLARFVVDNGPIELRVLGLKVEIAIGSGSFPVMFTFLPLGQTTPIALCAVTNIASASAEQIFLLDGTATTPLVKTSDVGIGAGNVLHMPMILGDGQVLINFEGLLSSPSLYIGSNPMQVANIAFTFNVTGATVSKAAVTAGTALVAGTIPQNKWGIYAFTIVAGGTITCAAGAGNGAGYSTEAAAIAGLPSTAAASVLMGYVTVMSTDAGGFIQGTSNLNDAVVTANYYNSPIVPATGAVKTFMSWYPIAMGAKVQVVPF